MSMKEWATAAEILTRAHALIEERGWQQGAMEPVPEECLATAVEHAFFEMNTRSIVDFNYALAAVNDTLGLSSVAYAEMSLKGLDVPYWGSALMDWNDAPGRTEAEILSTLEAAAALATARHARGVT